MIAIDTSSLLAYLLGKVGDDIEAVALALTERRAVLPPIVVTEIFSVSNVPASLEEALCHIPVLPILDGYWHRAARLRASVREKNQQPRLTDALIAQSCIDHDAVLVTRDSRFRHFKDVSNLKLFSSRS